MQITRAFVHVVHLDMVRPFRTSFGEVRKREVVILAIEVPWGRFYGEAAALAEPVYSPEYTVDVAACLKDHLLPRVLGQDIDAPLGLEQLLAPVRGHEMAKAAIVGAWTSAWAASRSASVAELLGSVADEVECGISLGIYPDLDNLLSAVSASLESGFRRVKLKIEPGYDVAPVAAVRSAYPDLMLTVDANGSYSREDIYHLRSLDAFSLAYIEQPLPEDDLVGHAMLQAGVATPLCLDESIVSVGSLQAAIALGAARVMNLKVGRVGGIWSVKRLHDICVDSGIPVWCGGLMESAIGQSECLIVAGLPGFRFPADIGPSERYFKRDLDVIGPLVEGRIAVPRAIGQPIDVDQASLDEATVRLVEVQGR